MKTFKQLLEDIHPKIKGALDAAPNFAVAGALGGAIRRIKGQAAITAKKTGSQPKVPNTGIIPKTQAQGSSRRYVQTKSHDIKLDGENIKLKTGLKVARKGWPDRGAKPGEEIAGQVQNRVEGSSKTQQHSVIRKNPDGSWSSNPKGVIPPVLHSGTNNKYVHVGHTSDLPKDPDKLRHLTKSESHPEGLRYGQLENAIQGHAYHDHPIAQKFKEFRKKTGIEDVHPDNLGVWKHPLTGEHHIVLRDAGYDDETAHVYHGGGDKKWARGRREADQREKFLDRTKRRRLKVKKVY